VGYLVFVQRSDPGVDIAGIAKNAQQHWKARVGLVANADRLDPLAPLLQLDCPARGLSGRFHVRARPTTAADLERARAAEAAGRAAGMSDLCARCPTVWEVEPEARTGEAASHLFAAALALTALGPVLPADGATLFGVRGAVQRADQAQKA
jgi:hypothetical protein